MAMITLSESYFSFVRIDWRIENNQQALAYMTLCLISWLLVQNIWESLDDGHHPFSPCLNIRKRRNNRTVVSNIHNRRSINTHQHGYQSLVSFTPLHCRSENGKRFFPMQSVEYWRIKLIIVGCARTAGKRSGCSHASLWARKMLLQWRFIGCVCLWVTILRASMCFLCLASV